MYIDAADAPDDQPDAQSTRIGAKIALDAFLDFDLHGMQVLDDLTLKQLSKETVDDEFHSFTDTYRQNQPIGIRMM